MWSKWCITLNSAENSPDNPTIHLLLEVELHMSSTSNKRYFWEVWPSSNKPLLNKRLRRKKTYLWHKHIYGTCRASRGRCLVCNRCRCWWKCQTTPSRHSAPINQIFPLTVPPPASRLLACSSILLQSPPNFVGIFPQHIYTCSLHRFLAMYLSSFICCECIPLGIRSQWQWSNKLIIQ